MNIWVLLIAVLCGIAIAQSLFLSLYLLFAFKKRSLPILFLAIMLLGLTLRIGKSYFFFVFSETHIVGSTIAAAGLWVIGPSLLLFVLSQKSHRISLFHYVHFIPTLFLLVSAINMNESWLLPAYFYGAIVFPLYVFASFFLFYRSPELPKKPFMLFGWSMAVISLIFLLQNFLNGIEFYVVGTGIGVVILYLLNFFILKSKTIFKANPSNQKAAGPELLQKIGTKLEELFLREKIHRHVGLTLAAVSKELDHPPYLISQTIKKKFKTNFNSFVNSYRIEEAKELLSDIESNHKIAVIAKEIGFSSTSSFYEAFKNATGQTPNEYRKQVFRPVD